MSMSPKRHLRQNVRNLKITFYTSLRRIVNYSNNKFLNNLFLLSRVENDNVLKILVGMFYCYL